MKRFTRGIKERQDDATKHLSLSRPVSTVTVSSVVLYSFWRVRGPVVYDPDDSESSEPNVSFGGMTKFQLQGSLSATMRMLG